MGILRWLAVRIRNERLRSCEAFTCFDASEPPKCAAGLLSWIHMRRFIFGEVQIHMQILAARGISNLDINPSKSTDTKF